MMGHHGKCLTESNGEDQVVDKNGDDRITDSKYPTKSTVSSATTHMKSPSLWNCSEHYKITEDSRVLHLPSSRTIMIPDAHEPVTKDDIKVNTAYVGGVQLERVYLGNLSDISGSSSEGSNGWEVSPRPSVDEDSHEMVLQEVVGTKTRMPTRHRSLGTIEPKREPKEPDVDYAESAVEPLHEAKKEDKGVHRNFKKYLRARYISSLKDETEDDMVGEEIKDEDVFMAENPESQSIISEPNQSEPLDLTHKAPPSFLEESGLRNKMPSKADIISRLASSISDRGDRLFVDSDPRSPKPYPTSPYHRSPPVFYSPQHLLSPHSPLCSVPEVGRIFSFNLSGHYDRAHSDPELLSPSPMSPGTHFTFPPRSGLYNSMSDVNRLPLSPRAFYPPSPLFKYPSDPTERSTTHSDLDMTFLCPQCGQVFPSYDNLTKHRAKHLQSETMRSSDSNKVHYCKVCDRAFARSDMLTRHMRLHTGLKPYECRVCGQVFSRSDHLNTHQRTHTGEKPYRCPQCPYAACRRDMITRHMRIHLKKASKKSRFLSVPDGESNESRKSSISSTDTTDSTEQSVRTCSISSVESLESDTGNQRSSVTSLDGSNDPEHCSGKVRHRSTESVDLEDGRAHRVNSFFADPLLDYRKSRNWSTTSYDSIESEEPESRRDSTSEDMDREWSSSKAKSPVTPLDMEKLQQCSITQDSLPM